MSCLSYAMVAKPTMYEDIMGIYIYIYLMYIYIRNNGIKTTKRCKHRLRLQREISRVAKKKFRCKTTHPKKKQCFFCLSVINHNFPLQSSNQLRWSGGLTGDTIGGLRDRSSNHCRASVGQGNEVNHCDLCDWGSWE